MRVRIRRIAKWGCLSLGSVMLVAAVVGHGPNRGWCAWMPSGQSNGRYVGTASAGGLRFMHFYGPNNTWGDSERIYPAWIAPPGLWTEVHRYPGGWDVSIPMSNLATLILGAGVILWRLDRRRAAYECPKCGYDRRGLAEGAVCPECGSTSPPQTPLRASASPR